MWLQTDSVSAQAKRVFPPSTRLRLWAASVLLVALLSLQGCAGYQLAADESSVFGGKQSTIRVREVDNPSLFSWVGTVVRSELRDEITNRDMATWRDDGKTDYSIAVIVDKITITGRAADTSDADRLFTTYVSLKAVVYDDNTNTIVWDSGFTSVNETYRTYSGTDQQAAVIAVRKATRYIVDRMRQTF